MRRQVVASLISAVTLLAVLLGGAPAATPAAASPWVERTLASLTLREKAAQMVMPWIPGGSELEDEALRRAQRLVQRYAVGGFIVGKGEMHLTAHALRQLQQESKVPLLVSADLESGAAMRLLGATAFPSHMALGATAEPELAYGQGRATALEARVLGVHVAFAPVADVNVNPLNPIINTRAFGERPDRVADMVEAFVRGVQDGGMLAVAKHFPGHGDTRTDSHRALPVIQADRARLDSVELVPFRRAIAAGVGGIMTAHIALPRVTRGNEPATLSRPIVTGILRQELAFDGLVFTDALNMAGVSGYSQGEVVVRAIAAGADIVLQPPNTDLAVNAIVNAVRRGRISSARVDASVRRILAAKERVDAGQQAADAVARDSVRALGERHRELAATIAARAITLVRHDSAMLPLEGADTIVSIVYTGRTGRASGEALERALRRAGRVVEHVRIASRAAPADLEKARAAAMRDGRVVLMSSYTQVVPGRATLGLPAAVARWVAELSAARPVIYASFGDPYVIAGFPDVAAYLLAWSDAAVSQEAAARALLGLSPIAGTLPISIPPAFEVGDGVRREPAN
ncbi:MAG: glycoside hydrolase family 3 protein [Gemmatimonadaceae bacterium]